ncbi:MAG: hypothetical protein HRU09_19045 [Oligoflexales bacterium]|nr:hypothetical protein [Oligoflexales bacterium]
MFNNRLVLFFLSLSVFLAATNGGAFVKSVQPRELSEAEVDRGDYKPESRLYSMNSTDLEIPEEIDLESFEQLKAELIEKLQELEEREAAITKLSHKLGREDQRSLLSAIGLNISNFLDFYSATSFIIAATYSSCWVQGPYVAGLTEALFPYVYRILRGPVPPTLSVENLIVYFPSRWHVTAGAYNYANYIAPVLLRLTKATFYGFYYAVKMLVNYS